MDGWMSQKKRDVCVKNDWLDGWRIWKNLDIYVKKVQLDGWMDGCIKAFRHMSKIADWMLEWGIRLRNDTLDGWMSAWIGPD